jgi:metallo-beta-lactamase class B
MQAERLFAFAAARGHPVSDLVVTHAHADRIGGAGAALRRGVRVHALARTVEHARARGKAVPDVVAASPSQLVVGGTTLEIFFPGAGHTDDNAVVWLPAARILDGGCLLRSARAADLGNVADADLGAWPAALARVRARYPDAAIVVPGHGPLGGDPIARTLELLAARAR